ncbi:MAG TPA: enoyl-CoA hydratase/isomerase family protein [Acidimicrobiales bacterium]|nr:enoyl-CoA hydratase/isomerase family protein [Acidimicrobiales bacterium]
MSATATVRVDADGGVARITLDRPDRRNALTGPVVDELLDAVRATRDDTRVLLLAGAGRHLCAGLDLDAFNVDPPPPWRAGFAARWAELHVELWADPRPLVVAHTGAAVGAGSALVFAGDVVVSGRSAFAHVVEAAFGMLAPVNIAWLVARHTPAVAAELALLAERVDADGLLARRLVTEVVDDDGVLARAGERAERLAGFPRAAVAATRAAVRDLAGIDLARLIADAQRHAATTGGPPRRDR